MLQTVSVEMEGPRRSSWHHWYDVCLTIIAGGNDNELRASVSSEKLEMSLQDAR